MICSISPLVVQIGVGSSPSPMLVGLIRTPGYLPPPQKLYPNVSIIHIYMTSIHVKDLSLFKSGWKDKPSFLPMVLVESTGCVRTCFLEADGEDPIAYIYGTVIRRTHTRQIRRKKACEHLFCGEIARENNHVGDGDRGGAFQVRGAGGERGQGAASGGR